MDFRAPRNESPFGSPERLWPDATQRCLNPGFSERIRNSRRTGGFSRENWEFETHRPGRRGQTRTRAWRTACQAAGVPTRFLHDCRRTAPRTLIRASVPERVAMLLTSHKSRAFVQQRQGYRRHPGPRQPEVTLGCRIPLRLSEPGTPVTATRWDVSAQRSPRQRNPRQQRAYGWSHPAWTSEEARRREFG